MAKKTTKQQAPERKPLISVNTEEPLEEEKTDIAPMPDEEVEDKDEEELDEDEVDPFGDKWEQ